MRLDEEVIFLGEVTKQEMIRLCGHVLILGNYNY